MRREIEILNAVYIAGEGGKITINHVIKNNGHEMDGLVIMEKGRAQRYRY